jgi:hypothetical protein
VPEPLTALGIAPSTEHRIPGISRYLSCRLDAQQLRILRVPGSSLWLIGLKIPRAALISHQPTRRRTTCSTSRQRRKRWRGRWTYLSNLESLLVSNIPSYVMLHIMCIPIVPFQPSSRDLTSLCLLWQRFDGRHYSYSYFGHSTDLWSSSWVLGTKTLVCHTLSRAQLQSIQRDSGAA